MELDLNGKKINIKEITYLQALDLIDLPKSEYIKKMIQFATDLTEEEVKNLSFKDGIILQSSVNKVNSFEDFQNPIVEK